MEIDVPKEPIKKEAPIVIEEATFVKSVDNGLRYSQEAIDAHAVSAMMENPLLTEDDM